MTLTYTHTQNLACFLKREKGANMKMYVLEINCLVLAGYELDILCYHPWIYAAHFPQRVTVGWLLVSLHPVLADEGGTVKFNDHFLQMNKLT